MRKILLSISMILMLAMVGCGNSSSTTQQAASGPQDETLPIQMEILIGTFKLEDTDQAVTSQQAAELLPLWQVYNDLSSSDTTAQEEVDGLIQQIQDTMTTDQMKAITDMHLTRQDMFTVMQDQGITQGRGQGDQTGNGGDFTPREGFGPQEGFAPPEGGPPQGFGGGDVSFFNR